MTLCSDNDHDLNSVFDHMKNQYGFEQTRLLLFVHVLVDMAHPLNIHQLQMQLKI